MMSKVTSVSYLHRGVIDTDVHVTAVSLALLCKSQRHWGVNNTTVPCAAEPDYRIENGVSVHSGIYSTRLVVQRCH
jgi:hypothetical protein